MGKTIWLMNHYASHMLFDQGGRHYYLAKYLDRAGYQPVVFCANTQNSRTDQFYFDNDALWTRKDAEEIHTPFVYVKARKYKGNGKQRVLNMADFYFHVKKAAAEYAGKYGKPDLIVASSVHPLTLVAGIQLAKKFGVKCISEVRDLWPESIVAYSSRWTRTNPIMRLLYAGEKWIYKKSDYVIMTWAGGYDYIVDRGWQKQISESKVVHISNGVDLEAFSQNLREHPYEDGDLSDRNYKNFLYTGSVKKVNNLAILVRAAQILKEMGNKTARILVYGSGNELEPLKSDAEARKLENIVFKGKAPKQCVPSILSQGYALILHNSSTSLDQYGQSQNKFFEYLAAGKPILMTYSVGHSVVKEERCGIEIERQTAEAVADAIQKMCELPEETIREYGENAARCAAQYDFKSLTEKLIAVIESL